MVIQDLFLDSSVNIRRTMTHRTNEDVEGSSFYMKYDILRLICELEESSRIAKWHCLGDRFKKK